MEKEKIVALSADLDCKCCGFKSPWLTVMNSAKLIY